MFLSGSITAFKTPVERSACHAACARLALAQTPKLCRRDALKLHDGSETP
jgi:tartrate dehydratase alpha subunit/fumarate hydratase class I-like protein